MLGAQTHEYVLDIALCGLRRESPIVVNSLLENSVSSSSFLPAAKMPPTIVLVPGMWHTAGCFSALRSELSPEYDTIARTLPCVGPPDPAKVGLIDDIEFIRGELLKPCLEEEKDVVLVMHSYGGIPGSVAVEGLGRADVESQGKRGGIVGLVYLSVIVIPVGESQADASRRAGLDFSRWYTFADDVSVFCVAETGKGWDARDATATLLHIRPTE